MEIPHFLKQLPVFGQNEVFFTNKEKQREKRFEGVENEFNLQCVEFEIPLRHPVGKVEYTVGQSDQRALAGPQIWKSSNTKAVVK